MKTRWGNSQSDVLSQVTYRPSDSHNNLSKNQLRENENYQTLNTFTRKYTTPLTTGGGEPAHKTNWEAAPPYRKKEMFDSQNDDNLVKIDFSEPFSKNCHNKEKKSSL